MLTKTQLIAPCGINCGLCMAYLRKKNKCNGCRAINESKLLTRYNCVIKRCEKRHKFCDCKKPCRRLKDLDKRYRTKYNTSPIENLELIKEHGVRELVKRDKKKWTCPECGSTISMHRGYCTVCEKNNNH
ncbi:MAG: DUF3795 domain-containing protein [Candidatus Woesearchaeota archaeon]